MARRWAAVLGSPIGHSLSPVLHRAAYAELGLDWSYDATECAVSGLRQVVAAAAADPGWAGFSVTMPLKDEALALADVVAPAAEAVAAANTLLPVPGGAVRADNTDVAGAAAVLGALVGQAGSGGVERVVVLGAGGTARAVLAALAQLEAGRPTIVSRDHERSLLALEVGAALHGACGWESWPDDPAELLAGADLVVCTVPAAATQAWHHVAWPVGVPLLDVVYDPWPTPLAAAALAAGAPVAGGRELLLEQAAVQVELMTGRPAPLAAMRSALDAVR